MLYARSALNGTLRKVTSDHFSLLQPTQYLVCLYKVLQSENGYCLCREFDPNPMLSWIHGGFPRVVRQEFLKVSHDFGFYPIDL